MVQARLGSKRFPKKVLSKVGKNRMIDIQFKRLKHSLDKSLDIESYILIIYSRIFQKQYTISFQISSNIILPLTTFDL